MENNDTDNKQDGSQVRFSDLLSVDLLPCIHCGSPMEFYIRDKSFLCPDGTWFTGWESGVNCTDEYCSLYIVYGWSGGGMIVEDIEKFVTKKWNKRFLR